MESVVEKHFETYWTRFCNNFFAPPITKRQFSNRFLDEVNTIITLVVTSEGLNHKDVMAESSLVVNFMNQAFSNVIARI